MVAAAVARASLFERVFPWMYEGASLVPEHFVNPEGLSERERRRESLEEMEVSKQIATAVALRALGHEIEPEGAEVAAVETGAPADGTLRAGDVIVRADDRGVRSPEDLLRVMREKRSGDAVDLVVLRDGARKRVEVGTKEGPNGRPVMGVIVQPELEFPVEVEIEAGDVGGPSAALAFALEVVDELGRDVDGGRRIAATGELALDGRVGEVGALKQKAIGARMAEAEIFVVPAGNEAQARRYADGLEVVGVSTFAEALAALSAS